MNVNLLDNHPALAGDFANVLSLALTAARDEISDLKRSLQQQSSATASATDVADALEAEVARLNALYTHEQESRADLEDKRRVAEGKAEALEAEAETLENKILDLTEANETLRLKLEAQKAASDSYTARLELEVQSLRVELELARAKTMVKPEEPETKVEPLLYEQVVARLNAEKAKAMAKEESGLSSVEPSFCEQVMARSKSEKSEETSASTARSEGANDSFSPAGSETRPSRPEVVITRSKPKPPSGSPIIVVRRKRPRETSVEEDESTKKPGGSSSTVPLPKRPRETNVGEDPGTKKPSGSSSRVIYTKRPWETSAERGDSKKKRRMVRQYGKPGQTDSTEHMRQLRELAASIDRDTFNHGWRPFLQKLQEALDRRQPGLVYVLPTPIAWLDKKTQACFAKRDLPHVNFEGMHMLTNWCQHHTATGHKFSLALMTTPSEAWHRLKLVELTPDFFDVWVLLVAQGPDETNLGQAVIAYTADVDPGRGLIRKYVDKVLESRANHTSMSVWENDPVRHGRLQEGYCFPHALNWLLGLVEKGLPSRCEGRHLVFLEGLREITM